MIGSDWTKDYFSCRICHKALQGVCITVVWHDPVASLRLHYCEDCAKKSREKGHPVPETYR
jgi:protein-arginine kinase activator protein McsA